MNKVCNVNIKIECVHTFGIDRYKRQADITILFESNHYYTSFGHVVVFFSHVMRFTKLAYHALCSINGVLRNPYRPR